MSIKENREALLSAAGGWDGVADEFSRAHRKMNRGNGRGSEFGALATTAGIDSQHDTFITSMLDALTQGEKVMRDIRDALIETARDFGATDAAVADTFHKKDGTPR